MNGDASGRRATRSRRMASEAVNEAQNVSFIPVSPNSISMRTIKPDRNNETIKRDI